jgi:hypothetical protein
MEYITTKNAIKIVTMSANDTIHSGAPSCLDSSRAAIA